MKQLYFMLCAVLMLLAGMPVSAQKSYGISGKVTDQAGNGIVGASVVVKGTTTGTSTGSDGSYSLNIKDRNATLVCSFIGMKSAETGINGRTEVNFTLEADANGLEEVVAIGYGTKRLPVRLLECRPMNFCREASVIRSSCFREKSPVWVFPKHQAIPAVS